MAAPRVLIAIAPSMYAEALAFSVSKHRPRAEVSLLDSLGDLEAEARRVRPHLIVANPVPPEAKAGCFWVEVAEPVGGEGAKALGAEISADGYSRSVADVRTEHVLSALDRAEEEHSLGIGHAQRAAQGRGLIGVEWGN
jgi:hypothetical protein